MNAQQMPQCKFEKSWGKCHKSMCKFTHVLQKNEYIGICGRCYSENVYNIKTYFYGEIYYNMCNECLLPTHIAIVRISGRYPGQYLEHRSERRIVKNAYEIQGETSIRICPNCFSYKILLESKCISIKIHHGKIYQCCECKYEFNEQDGFFAQLSECVQLFKVDHQQILEFVQKYNIIYE